MRGLQSAQAIDPGFVTQGIATAGFDLRLEGYDEPAAAAFHRQLAERLAARRASPEVAFVDSVPLSGSRRGTMVTLEGKSGDCQIINAKISAELLPSSRHSDCPRPRVRTARGAVRDQHVIIVSESTARKFWPGEDPIGKRVRVCDDKLYHEVVGVSKDIRATGLGSVDPVFIYFAGRIPNAPRHVAVGPRRGRLADHRQSHSRGDTGARFERAGAARHTRRQPGTVPTPLTNSIHPGARARPGRTACWRRWESTA